MVLKQQWKLLNWYIDISFLAQVFGKVISWKTVLKMGSKASDEALYVRESNQAVNKACCYVYTSGTTGPPKGNLKMSLMKSERLKSLCRPYCSTWMILSNFLGVMLSHDNMTWITETTVNQLGLEIETFLSYLPLSHIVAQMVDMFAIVRLGGTLFIADKNALKGALVRSRSRYL